MDCLDSREAGKEAVQNTSSATEKDQVMTKYESVKVNVIKRKRTLKLTIKEEKDMYCSKCGAELREGALFCAQCGAGVVVQNVEPTVAAAKIETPKEQVSQSVNTEGSNDFTNKMNGMLKNVMSKSGEIGRSVKKMGREKLALIISIVSTIAWIYALLNMDRMTGGLLDDLVVIFSFGGSITSMVMIRHNIFKDCMKAASLVNVFRRVGGFGGMLAMGIVLFPLMLTLLMFGPMIMIIAGCLVFFVEFFLPILPVGFIYFHIGER